MFPKAFCKNKYLKFIFTCIAEEDRKDKLFPEKSDTLTPFAAIIGFSEPSKFSAFSPQRVSLT